MRTTTSSWILAGILAGCGDSTQNPDETAATYLDLARQQGVQVDWQLRDAVQEYLDVVGGDTSRLRRVVVANPGAPEVYGICTVYPELVPGLGEVREIRVARRLLGDQHWLRLVVWHELAHCLGDLGHSGDPGSVMYRETTSENYELLESEALQQIRELLQ